MKTNLLAAALILGAVSCSAGEAENRHLLFDEGDRAEFIAELKSKNIRHHVDSEGGVWYSTAKEATVDKIFRDVIARRSFVGVNFSDPRDMTSFRRLLESAGIGYEIQTRMGKQWVIWDPKSDSAARVLKDRVDQESIARDRQERELPRPSVR